MALEGPTGDFAGESPEALNAHLTSLPNAKKDMFDVNVSKKETLTHTHTHTHTQVDDSGKVQRMRKQCPQCGPGTFMATHFDRVYCGKCTTTFLYEQVSKGLSFLVCTWGQDSMVDDALSLIG